MMIRRADYASDEEWYFALWCEELRQADVISDFGYQTSKFIVCSVQQIGWRTVREWTYTADFTIKWRYIPTFVQSVSETAKKGIIFHTKGLSFVDVKGGGYSGKYNNSDITFPLVQKILLYDQWIWINKFIVSNKRGSGFDQTFTPKQYLLTPTGKDKLLHYQPKLIEDITINT